MRLRTVGKLMAFGKVGIRFGISPIIIIIMGRLPKNKTALESGKNATKLHTAKWGQGHLLRWLLESPS